MKKILVHSGFFLEVTPQYKGEYIYKVVGVKEQRGEKYFLLEHDSWIKMTGAEMYVAERHKDERWARVEEAETDDITGEVQAVKELGFVRLST